MKMNHVGIWEKCDPERKRASSRILRQEELAGYIRGTTKKVGLEWCEGRAVW